MEALLLTVVILLQLVLIFLILQRDYQLLPEGFGAPGQSQLSKATAQEQSASSKNLWDNPPRASEELKLTVAEFKDNYNRSEPWDGDFAAWKLFLLYKATEDTAVPCPYPKIIDRQRCNYHPINRRETALPCPDCG